MNEFYLKDDGIRLHCKLEKPDGLGKFPLFILIHGLSGHMEERHIVAVKDIILSEGYGVLRVDLYGHGKSEGEFKNHTLFKWLSNVMILTDYVKTLDFVTDIYLCGHSQGGLTTIISGGMRPNDYKAIIPLSPAINIAEGSRKGDFLGVQFDPHHIEDKNSFYGMELNGNYLRSAQVIDTDTMIKQYKGPVLLVHGTKDQAVDMKYSVEASNKYENAKLVIIDSDTHGYDYHLDQVENAVRAFIKEIK